MNFSDKTQIKGKKFTVMKIKLQKMKYSNYLNSKIRNSTLKKYRIQP